ncbi:hypothetical protein [Pseudovibrio denitrificans]|nr:hypothetical protein [Pseudovibrio denitrificans]
MTAYLEKLRVFLRWPITTIVLCVCIGFYCVAFAQGAAVWFGWYSNLAWIVPIFLFLALPRFGSLAVLTVGTYGAYSVWDWNVLLILFAFSPGAIFVIDSGYFNLRNLVTREFEN